MTMLQHGLVPSTGGYQIERSLRFNSADSAYLDRTPSSAGNRKTWTWSAWVKRTKQAEYNALFYVYISSTSVFLIRFQNDDKIFVYQESGGVDQGGFTSALYRDPSAWYHIVLAVDTTQATDTNRMKLYVNGSQVTLDGTYGYFAQNADTLVNSTNAHYIGQSGASGLYMNGYMADVYLIDGQALTPSSFGETDTDTGVWKPKAYSGSYGTNGFYLKFADNSGTTSTTLGKDSSGNGNNWTPNNFSVTAGAGNDSLVDTPTPYGTDTGAGGEVRGNYCTLNPLGTGVPSFSGSVTTTYSNGNLQVALGTGAYFGVTGTFAMPSSGKWYWEVVATAGNASTGISVGASYGGASEVNVRVDNTTIYSNGSSVQTGLSGTTTDDVIGIGWNADTNSLQFYKNGSTYGNSVSYTPTAGASYFPFAISRSSSNALTVVFNFGQRPFAYTAPSGYKALCTQNLPTPTIGATATTRADDYFNTVLYTGDGNSGHAITGVGFQPDFVWIKGRSGSDNHNLHNAIVGATKWLQSDSTTAEQTNSAVLTSFDSDGFTVGSNASNNSNGATFVGWNWKANGAGSSNTSGTITSTVSANTTAGFSIVTYTGNGTAGATVGHGLGSVPQMIIAKIRNGLGDWPVYHVSIGNTKNLLLNTTGAETTSSSWWNNTTPTSTLVTLGNNSYINANTDTFVMYCFAPVAGYSAFGSYTANASTDGPFVYCGFRPRYVLIKASGLVQEWVIIDSARDTYNVANRPLYPHSSTSEGSGSNYIDFVSNGFKIRTSGDGLNFSSGATYIYAAFAEVPTKFSLAR